MCMRAFVHACTRACVRAGMHACRRAGVLACLRSCMHARICTGGHAIVCVFMRACVRACLCACLHLRENQTSNHTRFQRHGHACAQSAVADMDVVGSTSQVWNPDVVNMVLVRLHRLFRRPAQLQLAEQSTHDHAHHGLLPTHANGTMMSPTLKKSGDFWTN